MFLQLVLFFQKKKIRKWQHNQTKLENSYFYPNISTRFNQGEITHFLEPNNINIGLSFNLLFHRFLNNQTEH